jgi:hypothetical protein
MHAPKQLRENAARAPAIKCRESEISKADRTWHCTPRDLDHFAGWRDVPPLLAVQRRVELKFVFVALQIALNSEGAIVIPTSSLVCTFGFLWYRYACAVYCYARKDKALYVAPQRLTAAIAARRACSTGRNRNSISTQ